MEDRRSTYFSLVCGAAPVPADALREFLDRHGTPVIEGCGLSKTTVAVTIEPLDGERRPGSVVPWLPCREIRVAREDGEGAEPVEILVEGPNVMSRYLTKLEETEETLVDGWLRRTTWAASNKDGYLFLVDRTEDMIIRLGENVYPREIEHALIGHDALEEGKDASTEPTLPERING